MLSDRAMPKKLGLYDDFDRAERNFTPLHAKDDSNAGDEVEALRDVTPVPREPAFDFDDSILDMSNPPAPYFGRQAVLATMHQKQAALGPALRDGAGLVLLTSREVDTDQLGTFAGEIPRRGSMREVAIAKARLGMQETGRALGLASEGSFGPHPSIPFMPGGVELLTFVDDERGFVLHETLVVDETNFGHCVVSPAEAFDDFLQRARFPSHALMVRPNTLANDAPQALALVKGITDPGTLVQAIAAACRHSSDGKARIESDMRAHLNPTRMRSLAQLAQQLARRLHSPCPACACPGWGKVDVVDGLPCAACGLPTAMVLQEVFGCLRCTHRETRARSDGRKQTGPEHCPYCNP